jgi:hypothetical protein
MFIPPNPNIVGMNKNNPDLGSTDENHYSLFY